MMGPETSSHHHHTQYKFRNTAKKKQPNMISVVQAILTPTSKIKLEDMSKCWQATAGAGLCSW